MLLPFQIMCHTISLQNKMINVLAGVTVGFEQTVYSATEGVDASVEICAVLTQGTLEREAVVIFSTNDSKATALSMSKSLPHEQVYTVVSLI